MKNQYLWVSCEHRLPTSRCYLYTRRRLQVQWSRSESGERVREHAHTHTHCALWSTCSPSVCAVCAWERALWKVFEKVICFLWFHLCNPYKRTVDTHTQASAHQRYPPAVLLISFINVSVYNKIIDCFIMVVCAQVLFSHGRNVGAVLAVLTAVDGNRATVVGFSALNERFKSQTLRCAHVFTLTRLIASLVRVLCYWDL